MPIYAYKCASCGHAKDVLRKISDAPLTQCPACGAESFEKQVTAAGFQLKGSGWYVTDFRNNAKSPAPATADKPAEGAKTGDAAPSESKPADTGKTADAGSTPAPSKPDTPAASAG